jgi:hypothetical protein
LQELRRARKFRKEKLIPAVYVGDKKIAGRLHGSLARIPCASIEFNHFVAPLWNNSLSDFPTGLEVSVSANWRWKVSDQSSVLGTASRTCIRHAHK